MCIEIDNVVHVCRSMNMPMQAAWTGVQMQPGQQQQYNGQQQSMMGYPMQQGTTDDSSEWTGLFVPLLFISSIWVPLT